MKMVGNRLRVVRSAGDVAGAACAQQAAAEQVHARSVGDDAAVVTDSALVVEHRHVEPRMVGAEAGRPQDGADVAPAQIDLEGGGRDRRVVGSNRCGGSTTPASAPTLPTRRTDRAGGSASDRRGGRCWRGRPRTGPRRRAIVPRRPTTSTPSAASALRSSDRRSGVPISCGDGTWRARTRSSTSS